MRFFRRLVSVVSALAILAPALPAFAQATHTTNVTLARVYVNGTPVPYGVLCAIAVDQYSNPLAFGEATWGVITKNSPFCGNVVAGAIAGGVNVPDANNTNLAGPIYYNFTLQLTNSSGVATSSPVTLYNSVAGVTGATFALDTYAPTVTTLVPASNTFGYGSSVPATCTSPSIWTQPGSSSILVCNGGVYAAPTGAPVTVGTTAGTVAAGNDGRFLSSIKNQGTWNNLIAYSANDFVTVGAGASSQNFISILAGIGTNTNNPPATSPSDWQLVGAIPPTLKTNGTANTSQTQLNLTGGANTTLTPDSSGNVSVAVTSADGIPVGLSSPAPEMFSLNDAWNAEASLNTFRATLHNAVTLGGRVVVIGDSILCCIGPTNVANSPISVLRTALSKYGSAGTGFIPVGDNSGTAVRPEWTLAGTWTTGSDFGPSQTGVGAFGSIFTATGSGNTLSIGPYPAASLVISGETASGDAGCDVFVDGSGTATATVGVYASGASVIYNTTVTLTPSGIPYYHKVAIAPHTGGSCQVAGINFIPGTTGLQIDNFAHGYARTEAFATTPATQLAFVNAGAAPVAAIIGLGVNDEINGTGVTLAQAQAHMQAIITDLQTLNPLMSILIVDEQNVASTSPVFTQVQARQMEKNLAASNNIAYLSIADAFGSEANANTLGLMAGDGTHPSDMGGQAIGNMLAAKLSDQVAPPATVKPSCVYASTGNAINPADDCIFLQYVSTVALPASPLQAEQHLLINNTSGSVNLTGSAGGTIVIPGNSSIGVKYATAGYWFITQSTNPSVLSGTFSGTVGQSNVGVRNYTSAATDTILATDVLIVSNATTETVPTSAVVGRHYTVINSGTTPMTISAPNGPANGASLAPNQGADVWLVAGNYWWISGQGTPPVAAPAAWSNTATYVPPQSVLYNGVLWQALTAVPANQTPAVGSTYWTAIAQGPSIGTTNSAERFFYTGTLAPAPAANSVGFQMATPVTVPFDISPAGAGFTGVVVRTLTGTIDQERVGVAGTDFDGPGAAAAAVAPLINNAKLAGTGGVTVNTLVLQDGSSPAKLIAATGNYFSGLAAATAIAGAPVTLANLEGAWQVLADGVIPAGHIAIQSTTTPGYVTDSGQTDELFVSNQVHIVGRATVASTGAGTLVTLDPYGRMMRGGQGPTLTPQMYGVDCTGNPALSAANLTGMNALLAAAGAQWAASGHGSAPYNKTSPVISPGITGCTTYIAGASMVWPDTAALTINAFGSVGWHFVGTGSAVSGAMLSKSGSANVIGNCEINGVTFDAQNVYQNALAIDTCKTTILTNLNGNETSSTPFVMGDNVSTYNFGVYANNVQGRVDSAFFSGGSQPQYGMITQSPSADNIIQNSQMVNFRTAEFYNTAGDTGYYFNHMGGYSGSTWNAVNCIDDESPAGNTHIIGNIFDGCGTPGGAAIKLGSAATNNNGSYVQSNTVLGATSPGSSFIEIPTTAYNETITGNSGHGLSGLTNPILYDGSTISSQCNYCDIHDNNFSGIQTGGEKIDQSTATGRTKTINTPAADSYQELFALNGTAVFGSKWGNNGANPIYNFFCYSGTLQRTVLQFGSVNSPSTHLDSCPGSNSFLQFNVEYSSGTSGIEFGTGGTGAGGYIHSILNNTAFTGLPHQPSEVKTVPLGTPTLAATASLTGGTLAAGTYTYYIESSNGIGVSGPSSVANCVIASGTTGSCTLAVTRNGIGESSYNVYGRSGTVGLLTNVLLVNSGTSFSANTISGLYIDTGSATPGAGMPANGTSGNVQGSHFATLGVPTFGTFGAAAGTSPGTATITGHDDLFTVTFTEGTGTIPLGTVFSINFQNPHQQSAPDCGVLGRTGDQFNKVGVSLAYTTGVTVAAATALVAGATEVITVLCGNL